MILRPSAPAIGRRTILRGAAGLVGAVALSGCPGRGGNSGEGAAAGGGAAGGGGLGGGAAGGGSSPGGRPTVRLQGGTFGFPSPFAYVAAPGYWRMSYLFDTLLWTDATGQLLPWLAARHEASDDGIVHTLELRDAAWHDGRPMTARDVVFTFEYLAANTLSPLAIAAPRNVGQVTQTSERTVEIRLAQPDVTFPKAVLGSLPIIPEHIWSAISDPQAALGDETLIGTGPYRLVARDDAQGRLAYEANDAYFLGTPFVERIEMVQVDDELAAVAAGALDCGQAPVEGVRNDVLDPLRANPELGVTNHETAFAFPLYWNLSRGGALADVAFRRACLHAINRENLVRQLLTGNGTVGSAGFLPPTNPFHAAVDDYAYDRDAANRLLDEAGYRRAGSGPRQGPDGPLRFRLFVHDTVPAALPQLVAADLRQVGIEVDQQIVDLVRLFGIKTGGNYDLLITLYPGPAGTTPNGDPDALRGIYHSQPANQIYAATGYANREVDALLERQLGLTDKAERKEAVAEIQRIVARDLPVAVLYYTTMFAVYRRQVFDGWYYTQGGFGPGIPDVYNKHAFVTGQREGLEVARRGAAALAAGQGLSRAS